MSEELVGRTPEAEKTHEEFLSRCKANLQEEELREKLDTILDECVDDYYRVSHPIASISSQILTLIKQKYVQLDEDQSLPTIEGTGDYQEDLAALHEAYIQANFRRIRR